MRKGLQMSVGRRSLFLGLLTASILGGCASASQPTGREPVATEATVSPTVEASDVSDADPSSFRASVERMRSASSYRFEADVTVASAQGPVVVMLSGSRNGNDRTLTVTAGDDAVTYVVAAGAATVDRGDGPKPVSLTEVPSAPSIEALFDIRDLRTVSDGVVEGVLDAQAMLGPSAAPGDATVQGVFEPGGFLTHLEIRATDGSVTTIVDYDAVTP